jgi:uncharacterized protein (DUF486 family)
MRVVLTTALLLGCSNIFMTFAWYAHLKNLSHRPWIIAALVSWGMAWFKNGRFRVTVDRAWAQPPKEVV